MILPLLDQAQGLVLNVVFEDLLDDLVEFAAVVVVVTLVHDDLVHLDVIFVLDDAFEFTSEEAAHLIYVLLLNDGFGLFVR